MRTRTMIIVGTLVVVVAAGTYVIAEYNREPEGAAAKAEVASLSAAELLADFTVDEAAATARYVGKQEQAIRVTGVVRSINASGEGLMNLTLETGDPMAGVVCEFATADLPAGWKPGSTVAVKGICTGYLGDVILNRCAAVE